MYARRRALSTGAVLAATVSIVLGAAPAQAECLTENADTTAQWQVGATLGTAPIRLTGEGGLPALVLSQLPESRIAVKGINGRNLVRLDATTVRAGTETASLPETLPTGLDLDPVAGVHIAETDRAPAVPAAPRSTVDRAAQVSAPAVRAGESGRWEVLRSDDTHSALDAGFAWVPIEGISALGPGDGGLPWAAGIALLALLGGTAAVTVARGHRSAG